ncbi:anti-anti-sigma factor [Streptomyces umbrinus]|uniref:STAS domain-containing protein n=1 Tax=Streptomyces umbrinus TaxID=67370 RepID=UPI0019CDA5BD|nr:STAS domain-containing protein [Streptomyces umbrinus]MCR3731830.1 anti-anti-sigma factor [Streptomyces umbrinus]GHH66124.1 hypothetical protein GCM10018775_87700 [Streptomyces umbrinus]
MTDTHGAPSRQLSIGHTTIDGIRVVTLHGEIDYTVKHALTEALMPRHAAPQRTIVDLSGVTFMDSSGINIFIAAHQAATDRQAWLRIAGAQESVRRVLQLVGLDQLIPCYPTLEQALAA